AVNCTDLKDGNPCGECEMCKMILSGEATDIVEIDAASNNSVDDIRDLREKVVFSPAAAKYRVYIIDEVHMLSLSAFNALLKTLEEPPEHVVFILATTEVHKLPATILSRCQRFDFRRIDSDKIVERLKFVAEKEDLKLTDDAALLIAAAADGGMRDALSILDLCASSGGEIDEQAVVSACSMAGGDYLLAMADNIRNGDSEGALLLLDKLHNSSVDMNRFCGELTSHFRDLMIIKTVQSGNRPIVCSKARMAALEAQAEKFTLPEILSILNVLNGCAARMADSNRRAVMEMALLRLCTPKLRNDIESLEMRIAALEAGGIVRAKPQEPKEETEPVLKAEPQEATQTEAAEKEETPEYTDAKPAVGEVSEGTLENWQDIIEVLKAKNPLMAGVLKGSKAYIDGGRLLIDCENTQFKSLVNGSNQKYREDIKNAAAEVLGKRYNLGPYVKKSVAEGNDPLSAFEDKLKILEEG
ncbi:MAG: DNA polymerase III subunit gamma/tau, partial [Clostridia bacterium]|nr:DNA polymerase III subunit gamma/tau [Clostridia bacterium]